MNTRWRTLVWILHDVASDDSIDSSECRTHIYYKFHIQNWPWIAPTDLQICFVNYFVFIQLLEMLRCINDLFSTDKKRHHQHMLRQYWFDYYWRPRHAEKAERIDVRDDNVALLNCNRIAYALECLSTELHFRIQHLLHLYTGSTEGTHFHHIFVFHRSLGITEVNHIRANTFLSIDIRIQADFEYEK